VLVVKAFTNAAIGDEAMIFKIKTIEQWH
jgi:hypothetical protein